MAHHHNIIFTNERSSRKIDFFYTIRPIYFLSRVAGQMPFSFVRHANGEVRDIRVGTFDWLWFLVSIFLYLWWMFFCYQHVQLPKDANKSYIMIVVSNARAIFNLIVGLVAIGMDMYNRSRLIDTFKKFAVFDIEIAKFGVYLNYKKWHRNILLWCIVSPILGLLLTASHYYIRKEIREGHSTIFIGNVYCLAFFRYKLEISIVSIYVVLLYNLNYRFDVLISLLRNRFVSGNIMQASICLSQKENISFVKHIGRLYARLIKMLKIINYCYSIQVMFCVTNMFIMFISSFYCIYGYIISRNEYFEERAIAHLQWELSNLTLFFMICYAGNTTKSKTKEAHKVVHNIIGSCNDTDLIASLNQLSNQIIARQPLATCGLFVFDWTLTYTVIGAVTIYMTVLIQFNSTYEQRI